MNVHAAGALSLCLLLASGCRTNDKILVDSDVEDSGPVEAVDADGDGYTEEDDCDDADAAINPGSTEICDGVDNNCDGETDEGVQTTWYGDSDADGFGDDGAIELACQAPEGYVAAGGDCDDADANYYPGAPEEDCADPNDYNCDGSVGYADGDGDGWAACEECDDTNAAVNPDATEVCNEVDDNCDGAIDEGVTSTFYGDGDGDGFGAPAVTQEACEAPEGTVTDATDCDDSDAAVNPDASEVCNGVDDDCDSLIDDADDSVDLSTGGTWYTDADADGYGDAGSSTNTCSQPSGAVTDSSDCDDSDGAVNPGATEVCNEYDDDCDGLVDDADDSLDSASGDDFYDDADGDGFGDPSVSTQSCLAPSGYVEDGDDCDDADAAVNPDADEVCNEVDDDCDGLVDDADGDLDLATADDYYDDLDGDGYGDASALTTACDQPSATVEDDTDCDDSDAASYPGAAELCDGLDNDCDGVADDGVLGSGASCPATDCAEILADNSASADGTYTLTAGQYYCDMSSDGGGWTRVATDTTIYGTGYETAYYNSEGFTWDEALFQWSSGSVHAHCTYPESLTGCNNIGFQFDADDWGVAQNWGSSVCGMPTSDYTSATTYIGGYDFVIGRTSSTDTIRAGTLEGISSCTTADNPGTAYMHIYVRR